MDEQIRGEMRAEESNMRAQIWGKEEEGDERITDQRAGEEQTA